MTKWEGTNLILNKILTIIVIVNNTTTTIIIITTLMIMNEPDLVFE